MLSNHRRTFAAAVIVFYLIGFAPTVYADRYIGIDGSSISLEGDNEEDIDPIGLRLRMGTRLSKWLDFEAHLGGGIDNSTRLFDELQVVYLGLYLKGHLPIGQRSNLYALAGGSGIELTQTIGRRDFTVERNGISYGFGLETRLSKYWDLSADYIRYTLDDESFSEVSAINLGLKWYF